MCPLKFDIAQQMFEIRPNTGIGKLEYGMSLERTMEVMGSNLVYEEWMDGNLNDSICYSGIIIGFKPYDMNGPLPGSKIIEFRVNDDFPASLFGKELFIIQRVELMDLLNQHGYRPYQSRPYFVTAEGLGIHFDLDENEKVCFLEM